MRISIIALSIAVGLAGCGGGGSDSPTAIPDGLYAGTTNTGRTITGLVLDDGTYYVLYSVAGNPSLIAGVVQGTGTGRNGSFTSSNGVDINLQGSGVLPANVSAGYALKQFLNGSITYPTLSQTITFTGVYDNKYELAPSLAALAGTYTGTAANPSGSESATLTVSTLGAVSGSGVSGCTFSGTVTPRAKGNAYNATLTFGGSPCLFANTTVTGGAYFDALNKRLYAVGLKAARDNGVIFVGTKP